MAPAGAVPIRTSRSNQLFCRRVEGRAEIRGLLQGLPQGAGVRRVRDLAPGMGIGAEQVHRDPGLARSGTALDDEYGLVAVGRGAHRVGDRVLDFGEDTVLLVGERV